MRAILLLIVILLLYACKPEATPVQYGSNNGKYVTIQGTKIYYEEYGEGMPLLLLSGGGINRSISDFGKCIPGLSERYRVIAPDSPGQGRSEQSDTLTYAILAEFMSAFIDSLRVDSVYVMGWSDGGIASILLAAQRSDKVRKIIAVGANNGVRRAIPPEIPIDSVYPPSLEYFAENNKEMIERYMSLLPRDWKKQVSDLTAMWYEKEVYYPDSIYNAINIPVMIVLGDRDDIITEHGLDMHRQIGGSAFCVLPNTSHDVFAEKPELINRIALGFFGGEY